MSLYSIIILATCFLKLDHGNTLTLLRGIEINGMAVAQMDSAESLALNNHYFNNDCHNLDTSVPKRAILVWHMITHYKQIY